MTVALSPVAQQKFSQYKQDIARVNGVDTVAQTFSVAPVPEQKIVAAYQDSSDFLKKINFYTVDNAQGQKLGLQIGTTIASNTDTRITPRRPTPVGALEQLDEYLCSQTNYDIAYLWDLLNAWAHFPDFKQKLAAMVIKAIALDKQTMGFNGRFRARTSDRNQYPLLEDVKKGWLQKIREWAPEQCFPGTDDGTGKLILAVGATAPEYKTLDGLVEYAIENHIATQHQDGGDLVAICGRGLLSEKYLPMLNTVQDPTEQIAARLIYANKQLGTLPAVHVPRFPANTILITSFNNLSIYMQRGTMRRYIQAEPQWDRDVDYQSVNEDFVVEDYSKCSLLENIKVGN